MSSLQWFVEQSNVKKKSVKKMTKPSVCSIKKTALCFLLSSAVYEVSESLEISLVKQLPLHREPVNCLINVKGKCQNLLYAFQRIIGNYP